MRIPTLRSRLRRQCERRERRRLSRNKACVSRGKPSGARRERHDKSLTYRPEITMSIMTIIYTTRAVVIVMVNINYVDGDSKAADVGAREGQT